MKEREEIVHWIAERVRQAYEDGFRAGFAAGCGGTGNAYDILAARIKAEMDTWPQWKKDFIATTPRGSSDGNSSDE